ncbi:MAG: hypothetical protein JXB13_09190 [Phycisphaerae bacterium]|nr:hypothetical protein [Phycisphaerae bacterium]
MRSDAPRLHRLAGMTMRAWACALLVFVGAGCEPRTTRFQVVDYAPDGRQGRFFEEFDECYYARQPDGAVDVVARRRGCLMGEAEEATTQVIHLHGIWRPVPGDTAVESTQVNATVSYWIVGELGGIALEGGGFVFSQENHDRDTLTGTVESSALQPVRRIGRGPSPFNRVELTGKFRAVHDRRRTIRLINDMRMQFGPLPRYESPPPGPF